MTIQLRIFNIDDVNADIVVVAQLLLIITSLTLCFYAILYYIYMYNIYIYIYTIDVSIIRSIEAYQCSLSYSSIRVYFFMYEGSTEEHRYVSSLSKEKSAFESLIKSKEHMVISLPDDPIDLQHEIEQDNKHIATISMDTRTINRSNQQKSKEPRRIIVDVREFRSLLPSMLYSAKFDILPRTLEVADYVLSSDICVERKGEKDPW